MYSKIIVLFAIFAVAFAAPSPKPAPAPAPQYLTYSAAGLDYAYPSAAYVPSYAASPYAAAAPYAYSGYPAGALYY